ncbi:transcriptional regulator [Sporosarcina sp. P3]|uniref:DeoR/GlpR family DNA-binding transcription regulator n=1 Tax=Sporosarcina sp. P3 TaxID=2048245 RepID=UPI000C16827B|nr:DeoR/GlpR family DNA-binding transcription regulator [Sporosarcina sp. P3]PID20283.1 transcriptional regulator [Sporosarcina sp. P3]
MSPKERRSRIMESLATEGRVDIIQLSEVLNVTPMTIRRDFDVLEKQNKLIRTHGGAVPSQALIHEKTFELKSNISVQEKKMIAKHAVSFVRDGMTVLIDSGTTTLEIARLLKTHEQITVITNDIKIAAELMGSKLEVIIMGGRLQTETGTLYGSLTENILKSIHVDLFFLGANAIHSSFGITTPTIDKSSLKRTMIRTATETILVADSTKFNQKAFSKVCDLEDVSTIITDEQLSEELMEKYSELVEIIIAE